MAEPTEPTKPNSLPRSTFLPQPGAGTQPQQIVGMTAEQVIEIIKSLKEPSDEEKAKKVQELEQKKEMARQSRLMAEQDLTNRMSMQEQCSHKNERYHTFVGQVLGSGDAVALCQICRRDYKWRATPDQLRQGINLLEYRGLTEAHLLQWEKQFPPVGEPPDRIKLRTRAGKSAA